MCCSNHGKKKLTQWYIVSTKEMFPGNNSPYMTCCKVKSHERDESDVSMWSVTIFVIFPHRTFIYYVIVRKSYRKCSCDSTARSRFACCSRPWSAGWTSWSIIVSSTSSLPQPLPRWDETLMVQVWEAECWGTHCLVCLIVRRSYLFLELRGEPMVKLLPRIN